MAGSAVGPEHIARNEVHGRSWMGLEHLVRHNRRWLPNFHSYLPSYELHERHRFSGGVGCRHSVLQLLGSLQKVACNPPYITFSLVDRITYQKELNDGPHQGELTI